ncbi:amidohydrolase family protein [Pseudomonadota bacterium]
MITSINAIADNIMVLWLVYLIDRQFLGRKEDKLPIEEAIYARTMVPAWVMRCDKITGSLEVGKRADLVIVDTDLFYACADEIAQTKVLLTMMNGRVTHRGNLLGAISIRETRFQLPVVMMFPRASLEISQAR